MQRYETELSDESGQQSLLTVYNGAKQAINSVCFGGGNNDLLYKWKQCSSEWSSLLSQIRFCKWMEMG